ncbi:SDR family NAD(P)-dependent oxidoreductase [Halopelagius longus]|uniref:3-oxoacyl-[acyl-carrier protein] reductase n=1 Tax=Halopelagius longus TaxID=1236180 RepID=A0A1H1G997_9EURY|nr:SDR family oxidoreductase [Halopelagius longus]RDI69765.1 SDR family oxidoreductase [Halopelagius longus]SDR09767.1 3-oxoacyl-[acyl-carrier protein] reductase [Halopelagius longus]
MSQQLDGETAIITGSSQGIGKGIAERFAAEGANVVVNSRSQERADEAAEAIADDGGTAVGVEADVTDEGAMEALVETTVERFGGVDVMVNNAGLTILDEAHEFDIEEWRKVVDVDLVGTFIGCQAAGRRMMEQEDGGAILNISSLMGSRGLQKRSPYCAAKAGVNNLTQTLAVEWAEHDIHVNALAPGFIWTEITEQTQGSAGYTDDDIRDRTPMNRFGSVEEMAECALFLVGRNNFVTGEVLHADGGWQAYGWGSGDQ